MSTAEDKLLLAELGLQLCRVCSVHTTQCLSLYKPHEIAGEVTTLAALLGDCANLEILENEDFLPSTMCISCVKMLTQAHEFKRIALETDSLLRSRHARELNNINSRSTTPAKSQLQEEEERLDVEEESIELATTDEYVYVLEETESLSTQEDEPMPVLRFDSPSPKVELLEVDFDSAEDYSPEQEEIQQQVTMVETCVKQRTSHRRKSHNPSLQCQVS